MKEDSIVGIYFLIGVLVTVFELGRERRLDEVWILRGLASFMFWPLYLMFMAGRWFR